MDFRQIQKKLDHISENVTLLLSSMSSPQAAANKLGAVNNLPFAQNVADGVLQQNKSYEADIELLRALGNFDSMLLEIDLQSSEVLLKRFLDHFYPLKPLIEPRELRRMADQFFKDYSADTMLAAIEKTPHNAIIMLILALDQVLESNVYRPYPGTCFVYAADALQRRKIGTIEDAQAMILASLYLN